MILILGAGSYIGKHLFQAVGKNYAVATARRVRPGTLCFNATRDDLKKILDPSPKFSHAIILFGETDLDFCKTNEKSAYDVNVLSTIRALTTLKERGIKPVYFSSEYVFDGEVGNYKEEDPTNPTTTQGKHKAEVEKYIQENFTDYAILRLARTIGNEPEDGTILTEMWKEIGGTSVTCASDQFFSLMHLKDVVAIVKSIIEKNLSGIYHISNGERWGRVELLKLLMKILDREVPVNECSIKDFSYVEERPKDLSLNSEKILKVTGITPKSTRECCVEFSNKPSATRRDVQ